MNAHGAVASYALGRGVWEAVESDWRTAPVSEEALVDAIHICALFSMIVRLADSLGWDVPPFDSFYDRADGMLESGYRLD